MFKIYTASNKLCTMYSVCMMNETYKIIVNIEMPMMSNKVKFGEGQCLVNLKGG